MKQMAGWVLAGWMAAAGAALAQEAGGPPPGDAPPPMNHDPAGEFRGQMPPPPQGAMGAMQLPQGGPQPGMQQGMGPGGMGQQMHPGMPGGQGRMMGGYPPPPPPQQSPDTVSIPREEYQRLIADNAKRQVTEAMQISDSMEWVDISMALIPFLLLLGIPVFMLLKARMDKKSAATLMSQFSTKPVAEVISADLKIMLERQSKVIDALERIEWRLGGEKPRAGWGPAQTPTPAAKPADSSAESSGEKKSA